MAKNKFKKILKWTGVALLLGGIGVGVWQCVEHKDEIGNFFETSFNKIFNKEESKPNDETQNPDDNTGGQENPLTFNVKFKSEDTELSSQDVSVGGYSTLPEAPTKEGYNFLGYALEGTTEIVDPLTYPITENTVFVAVFEEAASLTFEVKFISDDSELSTQNVSDGEYATLPEDPTKEGYNFLGYTLEGTTEIVDPLTYPITENTVFVAVNTLPYNFENETLMKYIGNEEKVIIPSSYSLGITVTKKYVLNNVDELVEYFFDENEAEDGLVIIDANGESHTISIMNIYDIAESVTYPVPIKTSIQTYIDGNEKNVTEINISGFYECLTIKQVVIPSSVTNIANYAFDGCTNLSIVEIQGEVPPTIQEETFNNTSEDLIIYVPDDAVDTYKAAEGWSTYADKIHGISELDNPGYEDSGESGTGEDDFPEMDF